MLGNRWKEEKSRLISAIKVASKSADASRLAMLKHDNIKTAEEWKDFTKEKLSEEFELRSKKYKQIRAKNTIPHTMIMKDYARLAEELKKELASDIDRDDLWCRAHIKKKWGPPNSLVAECITKIKEHSNQNSEGIASLSEDGVAKKFGKERFGRIRGLGFGVTLTQLGVHMAHSKKVSALENEVNGLRNRLQELTDFIMTSVVGSRNLINEPVPPRGNTRQLEMQSHHQSHGSTSFPNSGIIGKKCKLLNYQKKFVAEGTISSTDPTALVHHVPLGVDTWKVWVDVLVEPQASVWRETSELCNIQQAIGTTVAWHKDFIALD